MFVRTCWVIILVILFKCLYWVLWRMFSIEGVVPASRLYWLILLEDIRMGIELFPGNNLILLDLSLDFILSCKLLIYQKCFTQYD